jgi:predicted RNA-binding protein
MAKYFILGASRDHVLKGVEGDFAQAGHGRKDLISKPSKDDWIVYYSAKDKFENGKPLQKFTVIGRVADDRPYQPDARSNFKPYRRAVEYEKRDEAEIRPLIEQLSFIKNKKRWGFYLMSGFREISKADFEVIRKAMK